jgi:hypothetical protein
MKRKMESLVRRAMCHRHSEPRALRLAPCFAILAFVCSHLLSDTPLSFAYPSSIILPSQIHTLRRTPSYLPLHYVLSFYWLFLPTLLSHPQSIPSLSHFLATLCLSSHVGCTSVTVRRRCQSLWHFSNVCGSVRSLSIIPCRSCSLPRFRPCLIATRARSV